MTGRLELSNGSPGGYLVEVYVDTRLIKADKTNTDGSYTISEPKTGIDPDLLRFSSVVCRQDSKYAHSPVDFQRNDSVYVANVPHLKLLSTTELKYTPEKARETIQVLVTVEAVLFRAGQIGTAQINAAGLTDAVRVLRNTGLNPQAKRRFVDNLVLDPSLPKESLDLFRIYLAR